MKKSLPKPKTVAAPLTYVELDDLLIALQDSEKAIQKRLPSAFAEEHLKRNDALFEKLAALKTQVLQKVF